MASSIYPDQIIHPLIEKYSLPLSHQNQLRALLVTPEIKTAVETGGLNPDQLIIPVVSQPSVFYIPHPNAASFILEHRSSLQELSEYMAHDPLKAKAYVEMREKVDSLEDLKLSIAKERVERKLRLRNISGVLEPLYDFITGNALLQYEVSRLPRAISLQLNTELLWLQKQSTAYFQKLFSERGEMIHRIEFFPKVDGVQLGNRMLIEYGDKKHIIFYVKTHQAGSLRSGGSSTATVDPKELFVYSALANAGFGPKTHFYFNPLSPSSFYIATQDEGFTKTPGKIKFFETYFQAGKSDKAEPPHLGNTVAELGIIRAEVLLRVFQLWDITSNSGNFGRVIIRHLGMEREKWRVIDFRVNTEDSYQRETEAIGTSSSDAIPLIFKDFREGKGLVGLDPATSGFLNAVLSEATPQDRVRSTFPLVEELELGRLHNSHEGERHLPLSRAMKKAYQEIKDYVNKHHASLLIDPEKALTDLENYHAAVQQNLVQFINGLRQTQSENAESVTRFSPFKK